MQPVLSWRTSPSNYKLNIMRGTMEGLAKTQSLRMTRNQNVLPKTTTRQPTATMQKAWEEVTMSNPVGREERVEEHLRHALKRNDEIFADRMLCIISNGGEASVYERYAMDELFEMMVNVMMNMPHLIAPMLAASKTAMENLGLTADDLAEQFKQDMGETDDYEEY